MIFRHRWGAALHDRLRRPGSRLVRAPRLLLFVLLPVLFCTVTTFATEKPIESLPGFFDFEGLELFDREELALHISVKGPLLQLVARASEDDPDLSGMLSRLRGVDVRVYDISEGRRDEVSEILGRTAEALKKASWQPAITVKVNREQGYAFLRYTHSGEATLPVGLAAMYLTDGNQAVFVNIVGELDTATIGRLARRFELDLLAVEPEN